MADNGGSASVRVEQRSQRDAGTMASFLGFFAVAWFGWGQAAATPATQPWLVAGSVLAALVTVSGVAVMVRNRSQRARMNDPGVGRRYGIIVATEFGAAGLGAVVLGVTGVPQYTPALVCGVVGVHFVPLAPVLGDRLLALLGVATCAVAILALVLRLSSGVAPSTVTGIGAGALLTCYALGTLIVALARRPTAS